MEKKIVFVLIILNTASVCDGVVIKKVLPNDNSGSGSGSGSGSNASGPSGSSGSDREQTYCRNTTEGQICNQRARLFSYLFNDNYNNRIRPFCGNNEAINVTVDVAVRLLMEVDEPSQILKLNAWIRMSWYDCHFVWNASEFGDIKNIGVPFSDIWVPDITLYDSVIQEFPGYRDFRPMINSDGMINYNFPTVIETQCSLNIRYFPFDTQRCALAFGSWTQNGLEIDVTAKAASGDLSSTQINTEWDVVSFNTKKHVTLYSCCPEPYPDVRFTIEMERKPLYYLVSIIIPNFFITLLGALVFILTVESGEKIGTALTVMLSVVVLLLIVSDTLPASAETLPVIVIYFAFSLCLTGFAGVMAVISINCYSTENTQMPPCIRKLFLGCVARFVLIHVPKEGRTKEVVNNLNDKSSMYKSTEPQLITVSKSENQEHEIKIPEVICGEEKEESSSEEWKILSNVLDRIGCILYIIVLMIGTVMLILQYSFQS